MVRGFNIKIADRVLTLKTRYKRMYEASTKYLTKEPSEAEFFVTDEEMDKAEKSMGFSASVAEYRVLQDKVNNYFIEHGMVMMHSSVIAVDGEGYGFSAVSGGGKSTQSFLWLEHFGERAEIINGDFPLLSFEGEKVYAFGTPWCGKEHMSSNKKVPLKCIFFIEKSDKNKAEKLCGKDILKNLFFYIVIPDSESGLVGQYMKLADRLVRNINFFRLECTVSDEAVVTAFQALN